MLGNCKLSDKEVINTEYPFRMIAVSKMMKNNMFHILTPYNFVSFSIDKLPPFKITFKHLQEGEKILSGRNLKDNFWIVATNHQILALDLCLHEQKAFINPRASLPLDKMPLSPQLFIDEKSNLLGFLNSSTLCVYVWNGNFKKIFTSKVAENKKLAWVSYLHFGTSTSTINKYENTIALLIHTEYISTAIVE